MGKNTKRPSCVNVSQSTSAKAVAKSETLAGSFTASSTASSLMARCHPTRPSEAVMIPSTPSSPRLALASTSPYHLPRFGAYRDRRGPYRHLPSALPPRVADLRQGGRSQYLRSWSLHRG